MSIVEFSKKDMGSKEMVRVTVLDEDMITVVIDLPKEVYDSEVKIAEAMDVDVNGRILRLALRRHSAYASTKLARASRKSSRSSI